MLGKLQLFFILGFLWLFLFSIPVSPTRNVYDLAFEHIVDTRPVHWMLEKTQLSFSFTARSMQNSAQELEGNLEEKFSQKQGFEKRD